MSLNYSPPVVGPTLAQLAQGIPTAYREAEQRSRFERTLADLAASGQPVDAAAISRAALMSGNAQLGLSAAQLAGTDEDRAHRRSTDARDFAFREIEANRAQRNTQFNQGLESERQALARRSTERQERQPVTIQTPAGPVTAEPVIGQDGSVTYRAPQIAGQPAGANPYSDGGRFNSEQGRAAGFSDRMLQSESILRLTEQQGTSTYGRMASRIPIVGNSAVSADFQRFDQARRDFINAQLRRESGAAISPSEYENADRQYFPQPGDSPQVIEQKRRNRQAAVIAMAREGGPNYRPGYIFNDRGDLLQRPAERRPPPTATAAAPQQSTARPPQPRQQPAAQPEARIIELDGRRYRVNGPGDYEEVR